MMAKDTNQLNSIKSSPKDDKEYQERQWTHHLHRLIIPDSDEEMKHSIHCSPDTRPESVAFDLLDKFGRSIKESINPTIPL